MKALPIRYRVPLQMCNAKVTMYQVGRQDTLQDIHLFLDQNEEDIHIDEPTHQQMFIKKIADRSNGSFLWTNLVLRQLRQYWNEDALENVIQNVPQGMEFQYDDILKKTCESVNGVSLACVLHSRFQMAANDLPYSSSLWLRTISDGSSVPSVQCRLRSCRPQFVSIIERS